MGNNFNSQRNNQSCPPLQLSKSQLSQVQAFDAVEHFFYDCFPTDVPIKSHKSSSYVTEKWLNGIVQIGDDYTRMLCEMSLQLENRELKWLSQSLERNEKRKQLWVKKLALSRENVEDDLGAKMESNSGASVSSGIEFTCSTFEFNIQLLDCNQSFRITKHLHASIMSSFSEVFEQVIYEGVSVNSNSFSISLKLDGNSLSGLSMFQRANSANQKKLYLTNLIDLLALAIYCPYLFIEFCIFARLDEVLEVGGDIYDKDFYIKDLMQLFELVKLKHLNVFNEYLRFELMRQGKNRTDDLLQSWEHVMLESLVHVGTGETDNSTPSTSMIMEMAPCREELITFSSNLEGQSEIETTISVVKDLVLCRSNFFNTMISSGMSESQQHVIGLECSIEVMKNMFNFVYTGSFTNESIAIELLMYCDMVGFKHLSNRCAHVIKKNITSIEEAKTIYDLAKSFEHIRAFELIKIYTVLYCYYKEIYRQNFANAQDWAVPEEMKKNERVEDFTLQSTCSPSATVQKNYYRSYEEYRIVCYGIGTKSGANRLLYQRAHKKFDNSTLYQKDGIYYGPILHCGVLTKSSPINDSVGKVILCLSVLFEGDVERELTEIFNKIPKLVKRRAVRLCLTMCDLPRAVWKIDRDALFTLAIRHGILVIETSALLGVNVSFDF
ncbi:hypothetical protein FDP41_011016 [Naegleria fowleri]|uniref:BTB domain-containing protein n=1 Tax=Naegleria fowleri TaxID=5763 RepID=A0A6A5CBS6_NAEFO|nr:uncharacterized protein FDP41_011016 [Naegleria fowleri]KAF0983038.1 hypothetical protein FDP41_011016 [Naegleria fowleri]CAG4707956.1 unnamed protein product [Naegleria fowleri]